MVTQSECMWYEGGLAVISSLEGGIRVAHVQQTQAPRGGREVQTTSYNHVLQLSCIKLLGLTLCLFDSISTIIELSYVKQICHASYAHISHARYYVFHYL